MDTTIIASPARAAVASRGRDIGETRRRAYLDTYARRRSGDVNVPAEAVTAQQEVIAAPEPVSMSAPVTQQASAPISDFLSPQAAAEAIVYTPAVQAQPEEQLTTSHQDYLQSLTTRHQQAVVQAPSLEETVFEDKLAAETTALFEDAKTNQKLEANLRALYDEPLSAQVAKNQKSLSHIHTIVASAFACGILAVGIFSFVTSYDSTPAIAQPVGAPVIEVEAPNQKPAGGNPIAGGQAGAPEVNLDQPVRFVVSSIGVNAPVEGLGTTADGLIAVPQAYGMVGWYNKGVVPGQDGPAVLVGHYTAGSGGVFDNLNNVKEGDLVTVTNGHGESFTYKVTKMTEYDKDKVPMNELFKKGNGSRLEIITCAGKWQANNYDKRLVVTAELVR
jgi:LPXTG-site transpeptidase (sortase) family protein